MSECVFRGLCVVDNMRVHHDPQARTLRLGFSDCSNCCQLRDREEHAAFMQLCYALGDSDGRRVAQQVLSLADASVKAGAVTAELGGVRDTAGYSAAMQAIVARCSVALERGELTAEAVETALEDSYALLTRHSVRLDPTHYLMMGASLLFAREAQESNSEFDVAGAAVMHMSDVF